MSSADVLLEYRGTRFGYGVGDWRLEIPAHGFRAGCLVGVLGHNGSGKSTMLRLAAGVLQPTDGQVLLRGRDLAAMPRREIARAIGYLPQAVVSEFDYRAGEVVAMGRYPHLGPMSGLRAADRAAIARSVAVTEIGPFLDRPLSSLSGGERKRVFLASVLAQEPRLLLLDEPTAALDVHHQVLLFRILRELASAGLGVVVVSHDINLVSVGCDRVVLLEAGRIRAEGSPLRVLTSANLVSMCGADVILTRHPVCGKPVILPPAAPTDDMEGTR